MASSAALAAAAAALAPQQALALPSAPAAGAADQAVACENLMQSSWATVDLLWCGAEHCLWSSQAQIATAAQHHQICTAFCRV